ncbi:MAG: T9SS type A sorting domain-containing protein [Parabacteroides sp.]|nr:T9SS type A sorting domain-containing protein [Parabacteroides sp.]
MKHDCLYILLLSIFSSTTVFSQSSHNHLLDNQVEGFVKTEGIPSLEEVIRKNELRLGVHINRDIQFKATLELLDSVYYYDDNNELSKKYVYFYDNSGKIKTVKGYELEQGKWKFDNQQTYKYNQDNLRSEILYQEWNGITFENDSRELYAYDTNNREISYKFEEWDDNGFNLVSQTLRSYFPDGKLKTYGNEYWEDGIMYNRMVYEYDSSERPIKYEMYGYDSKTGKHYLKYSIITAYDKWGNSVFEEKKSWNGSEVVLDLSSKKVYNEQGFITQYSEIVKSYYSEDIKDPYSRNMGYYKYDSQNRLTERWYKTEDYQQSLSVSEKTFYKDEYTHEILRTDTTINKDTGDLFTTQLKADKTFDENGRLLNYKSFKYNENNDGKYCLNFETDYSYKNDNEYEAIRTDYDGYENIQSYKKFIYRYIKEGNKNIEENINYVSPDKKNWVLDYSQKYEYVKDDDMDYYLYYRLDESEKNWVAFSGQIQDYRTIVSGNTVTTYNVYGHWDENINNWYYNNGYKRVEENGEHKKVSEYFIDVDSQEWEMERMQVFYYSNHDVVSNEIISDGLKDVQVYGAKGKINIRTNQNVLVQIYSISGVCCYNDNVDGFASISNLTSGVYIVRIGSDNIKIDVR